MVAALDKKSQESREDEEEDEMGFEGMGLDPRLLRAVIKKGLTKPTPIQLKAVPLILVRFRFMPSICLSRLAAHRRFAFRAQLFLLYLFDNALGLQDHIFCRVCKFCGRPQFTTPRNYYLSDSVFALFTLLMLYFKATTMH